MNSVSVAHVVRRQSAGEQKVLVIWPIKECQNVVLDAQHCGAHSARAVT